MNDIFFTSDTHWYHENIIQYSNRPFANEWEMSTELIDRWNARVKRSDTVYHLGDFALTWKKSDSEKIRTLLSALNGQKHLIIGNHDRDPVVKCPLWNSVGYYKELKLDRGGVHKQRIALCHYSMRSWNQMHRGSWMLFGHSHGNLPDIGGKTIDVGVDVHNYAPISIDEVEQFMSTRHVVACDHHVPEEP